MNIVLAVVLRQPLFGSVGLALLAVCGVIAVFLTVVALIGRWLAATHPAPAARHASVAAPGASVPAPEPAPAVTAAIIAASVTTAFGAQARVAAVRLVPQQAPSVEMLMQQWSMEGRRQIYSSHKVR